MHSAEGRGLGTLGTQGRHERHRADGRALARFRRCCEHYGYWGLALLEAIVRQADHQVSALGVV